MLKLEDYLDAATRQNTRRSYESALRHFEQEWGGYLPATTESVVRYLVDHASKLSLNTLRHRLAALSQWHREQGFVDPCKSALVRKTLKGIRVLHPATEQRAVPLQIEHLSQVVVWLENAIEQAAQAGDHTALLRHSRDKSLLLLGFWRAFRGDELTRLCIEHVSLTPGEGMSCFLRQSKGDRQLSGRTFKVPALSRLCPVSAYIDWIQLSGLTSGPVFRAINRAGHVSDQGLHINSLIPLLRRLFTQAGLPSPEGYSSHSLRRGFAGWANTNGWDVKTLMEYVGWRDLKSAMRYVDAADPFSRDRIERGLANLPVD
ncbi:site-specific integrase [Parachitinimonas caeni]|uniref:Site-specific integrase n=1 Tax=Parachitinimonas caeni TaxID=3031301 RepID=A0ABT7E0P0_9NEIS|nr:site-specific integrase [Parachitinimonas caeni]MDK2125886.1 site-specific integrase [Parachitinimonas caeni]